jgi:glutathione S-transferase
MMTLYYRPTCAFCRRVLAVIERLSLEVEMKDISEEAVLEELVQKGGQQQVPYFVDTEHDVAMYESDDIVAFLQKTYGTQTATSRPRVHVSGATCVSCEG